MNQTLPTRADQLPIAETVEDLEVFGLKDGRVHRLREGGFQAYVNDETARRVEAGVAPYLDLIAGKVSPDDLAEVAKTGNYEDLAGKPVLGSAAAQDVEDFLQPTTGVVRLPTFAGAGSAPNLAGVKRVFVEDIRANFTNVESEPAHDLKFFNGVWWEVDEPELAPEMAGMTADFDGSTGTDNAASVAKLLHAHSILRRPVKFLGGRKYYCGSSIVWNDDYLNIDGDFSSSLHFPAGVGYMFNIGVGRSSYATKALTANVVFGGKTLSVDDTTGIEDGDIVLIRSNKAWYNDPRPNPLVSNAAISFTSALGTTTTALLDAAFAVIGSIVGQSITFTSGANAGMARRITAYDNSTKTVTFEPALPAAVASGVRYVIPEAVKGQTCRVGRVVDGSMIEVCDTIEDGYFVADADPTLIKEEVNLVFYKPYSPRIRGIRLEGDPESTAGVGVGIYAATDVDVDVITKNCRSAGGQFTRLHRGSIHVVVDGANRVETGYGSQISECAAIDVSGRGWNNRRLFDVSGNAPSDSIRVHGLHVDGGGLQADGEEYYPLGTVSNYGVGSHGAARKTIYEHNSFYGVEHAIYERGRGAIVRHNYFGPGVRYPVSSQFGGRMLVENNVIDAGLFDNVEGATESETSGFDGSAYAECVLLLGANLLSLDPADSIIVRGNVGAVRANIVQFQTVGGSARTLPNVRSYGNDIEFFPPSSATPVGAYGKMAGSSAASVVLSGGRHDNAMRTAAANLQPTMFTDATIVFGQSAGTKIEYGAGKWTMRLADDTAGYIPVAMGSRDKMRVDISLEEDDTNFFSGWVKKGSATLLQIGGNNGFEGLAVEPNGSNGTDGKCQLHYAAGKLFIGHRLSGNRTYNVQMTPTS